MAKAMSTVGQGSTSYIAAPNWSAASATEGTGGYFLRLKFSVPSLAALSHLIGSSASSAGSVRVLTDGSVRYRNNTADLITSAASVIVVGQVHEILLRRLYTPAAAIELLVDGVSAGTTTNTTLGFLTNVNQLGRFSTTARNDITVYEFELFNGASSYIAEWDDTGASGSGVNWADDTATRNLTITNATGATDSWWLDYGGANTTLATVLASVSTAAASLSTSISMSTTMASYSAIVANLAAGSSGIAAAIGARSSVTANLSTQVTMASATAARSSVTATLADGSGPPLSASFGARSSLNASLTTSIQLAAMTNASALITAQLATNAALLSCSLQSRTVVSANLAAYKQVTFEVVGIPDGTYKCLLRQHPAGPVVFDGNLSFSAETGTAVVNTDVGVKVAGYVIDALDPAENGSVLYGVTH